MTRNRVWIEIVLVGTAIACALALLFATLGAVAAAAADAGFRQESPSAQAYEGMVTCSRCGAKHSAAMAQSAATCVRVCVHDGATFALVDANSTYLLDGDVVALKRLAGQRARIVGSRSGRTIRISSAEGI